MPGVYLSYPFCPLKCSFCNFASGVFPRELEASYGKALLRELRNYAWKWTPDTIYFGGGTPSRMDPELLRTLLAEIPGRPWVEATIEALPGTLTSRLIEQWLAAGITRVSLGVQSFEVRELAQTGRTHDAESVAADCELLRACGCSNISLDLIAGLPGQTATSWERSLDWIERLNVPHVSVYMLEVDEDSRLGLEILQKGSRFGAGTVPSDGLTSDLYEAAVERLRKLGLHRYEISNFARPGFESVHNLKYWTLQEYAGFGADAHSFDGNQRTCNVETAAAYVAGMMDRSSALLESVAARPGEERFFIGLRLAQGIRPTADEWTHFRDPIDRFLFHGLLEIDGDSLRLTDRGVLLSNEVFMDFLAA